MSRPTLNTLKKLSKALALQQANATQTKAAGDISSVFPSLSGNGLKPLPERFADLQKNLVLGRKQSIVEAWTRLLASLEKETKEIKARGSHIIPSVDFTKDITVDSRTGQTTFKDPEVIEEIRKRGAVVIRNVLDKDLARSYKF
ncbi:hypothetical protein V1523DRAFT_445209, partial [Lipomyces doorenjongii]